MSKEEFYNAWVQHAHRYINPFTDNYGKLELLKNQQFIDLMERAPSVVFILNHASSRYEFFSKNVKEMMGYTSEEMVEGGVIFGANLVDDSHRDIVQNQLFPSIFKYFTTCKEDIRKIRITFNFKFKRKDGNIRWALQHMSVIETDENEGPLLTLIFMSDITALKKDDHIDFSVAKLTHAGYYEPVFTTSFPAHQETYLTSREWDIVSLINKGKTSAEIAEILHISNHTVKTHRKNILEKFQAKNTPYLLDIIRRKGLV